MCVDRKGGGIIHDHFYNLCAHLKEGDLLVMNDSRVIPARLYGEKIGNGTFIEFLLLEQKGDKIWEIILPAPAKKQRSAQDSRSAEADSSPRSLKSGTTATDRKIRVRGKLFTALEDVGQMPLAALYYGKTC